MVAALLEFSLEVIQFVGELSGFVEPNVPIDIQDVTAAVRMIAGLIKRDDPARWIILG